MNKKILIVAAVMAGWCVGCAAPQAVAQSAPGLCSPQKLRLVLDENLIRMQPSVTKCISKKEFTIKVQVQPNYNFTLTQGMVQVKEKINPAMYTITGSNDDASDLTIVNVKITGDSPDGLYAFDIVVDGHGSLDPRVQIIDIDALRVRVGAWLEELALEELGVTLTNVAEAIDRESLE